MKPRMLFDLFFPNQVFVPIVKHQRKSTFVTFPMSKSVGNNRGGEMFSSGGKKETFSFCLVIMFGKLAKMARRERRLMLAGLLNLLASQNFSNW